MKVKIKFLGGFDKTEEEVEVEKGKRYSDLLKMLGINPETVVVVRNGKPVPVDDFVEEGEIVVMRVISGG
ncbi:MoaD/ThiS family protein [Archaeoglobus profundus]|uniref:ThiamineS protein n=1 Tax=Archaeoglobus profundus (strain DSM 5631 / JCM 9629 / NBRC 100127 / Av18) TaxID=572546 RepID=D2RFN1_ARCPA|nr:MoaD/ThiS family protein [Archaeoglobus profundus]ADB57106.1 thiamineS protein [Archaeoglobus profundus DSM 5631]